MSFPFNIGDSYDISLRSGSSGTARVVIPDILHNPEIQVYFDFLRSTSVDPLNPGQLIPRDTLYEPLMDAILENVQYFMKVYGVDLGFVDLKSILDVGTPFAKQSVINLFLNQILSSVQTNRQRSGEGRASISLRPIRLARHTEVGFADLNMLFNPDVKDLFDQLLGPDVFVYVFGRGRLYPENIYPMFTGLTTSVSFESSQGFDSITVQCEDVLKLLRLTWYNFKPGLADPRVLGSFADTSLDNTSIVAGIHPFAGLDAGEIVQLFILGTNTLPPNSQIEKDKIRVGLFGILRYGLATDPDLITSLESSKILTKFDDLQDENVLNRLRSPWLVMWGQSSRVNPYIEYFEDASKPFDSEHRRRIDTLREIAERTYSEFYADAVGNIFFHPMRVSVNFLDNLAIDDTSAILKKEQETTNLQDGTGEVKPTKVETEKIMAPMPGFYKWATVIPEEEMMSSSFTISDAELTTVLGVTGQVPYLASINPVAAGLAKVYPNISGSGEPSADVGTAIGRLKSKEMQRLFRFGNRRRDVQRALLNVSENLYKYAEMIYKLINKDLLSASVTLIMRPELELARPVFIPHRRELYYVDSISHFYTVGGLCTTQIGLTFGRPDNEGCTDLIDYLIQDFEELSKVNQQLKDLKQEEELDAPDSANPENTNPSTSVPQTPVAPTFEEQVESSGLAIVNTPQVVIPERNEGGLWSAVKRATSFGLRRLM